MQNSADQETRDVPRGVDATATMSLPEVPNHDIDVLVGRGGMGRVYRARQRELGRTVAVKLLIQEPDDKSLTRFREECKAVARLQHPNIAQLYESGSIDGRPYFTQEFLAGGSLADKYDGQPQDPREAARLVETIARAIHFSHQQGILHRDLKPSNILLTADGVPKVTDFGLAKAIVDPNKDTSIDASGLTQTGEIVGTPSYMAPEQASGVVSGLGPPADVYALGAILYEALTGRPPFQAPDAIQTLFMVLSMDPVEPRVLQPKLPLDIQTICLKCLDKSPKRRYATAEQLADDLARYQRGEPIVARPISRVERGIKWSRRHKAAAALIGVTAFFLLAMIGSGVWVVLINMRLNQANVEIAARKLEVEKSNAELNDTNQKLAMSIQEAEQSYQLAKGSLDSIPNRLALRLFRVPQAEGAMLEAYRTSVDFYSKLIVLRPNDEATVTSYATSLELLLSNLDTFNKRDEYTKTREVLEKFLQSSRARFPHSARLHAQQVNYTMHLKQSAESGTDEKLIKERREEFIRVAQEFIEKHPNEIDTNGFRINTHFTLGNLAGNRNNLQDRATEVEKALKIAEQNYKDQPKVESSFVWLNTALIELAMIEEIRKGYPAAKLLYERALEHNQSEFAKSINPLQNSQGIADTSSHLARVLFQLSRPEEALELSRKAEKLQRNMVAAFPMHQWKRYELANILEFQGTVISLDDRTLAMKLLQEALDIVNELHRGDPNQVQFKWTKESIEKQLTQLKQ